MLFEAESEALKKSAWPRCDKLAEDLAARGSSATEALEAAASSRTLHVRGAALRALAKVNEEHAKALASRLLSDRAYEVRQVAAHILNVAIPDAPKKRSSATKGSERT